MARQRPPYRIRHQPRRSRHLNRPRPVPYTRDNSGETTVPEPTTTLPDTGTLENPIPVGRVATVDPWSVRVVSVTPNATDAVMTENEFNDPPAEGEQFFMAALEATYQGDESSTFWIDVSLKAVGESNVAYEAFEASCGVIPDSIDEAGETFPGGTITGNTCWRIDRSDARSLVMIAEESFSFEGSRVFLSTRSLRDSRRRVRPPVRRLAATSVKMRSHLAKQAKLARGDSRSPP